MLPRHPFALPILALVCALLPAGAAWPRDFGVGLYVDQDLFVPAVNNDRDYTMGLAMEVFEETPLLAPLHGAVDWLGRVAGRQPRGLAQHRSFMIGTVNYTPDDLSDPNPIFDDRPYASLLYVSVKQVVTEDDHAVGVSLRLGLLGSKVAREVQSAIHRLYRESTGSDQPVEPRGWTHQISDGGEPTARARIAGMHLLARSADARWWDVAWTWDATLGYQMNLGLGLTARVGRMGSSFWSVPFDPVSRGNFLPSTHGNELFLWAGARARLVGYDALLQGQFRDSTVSVSGEDLERVVLEGAVGMSWSTPRYRVSLAVNGKSPETSGRHGGREHFWGGIYVTTLF